MLDDPVYGISGEGGGKTGQAARRRCYERNPSGLIMYIPEKIIFARVLLASGGVLLPSICARVLPPVHFSNQNPSFL